MAPSPRREPLQAAPRSSSVGDVTPTSVARVWDDPEPESDRGPDGGRTDAPPEAPPIPRSRLRSALLGAAVGAAVAMAAIGIAFSIVAIPLFALASIDPGSGLDRDLVRKGLFFVALPFGGIAGLLTGIATGVWYGRGGRLPRPDLAIHER